MSIANRLIVVTVEGVHGQLPPDPFAGDPNDPAAELDELEPAAELDADERSAIEQDLLDLDQFQTVLQPHGVRGIVVQCADCEEDHFHEWEILRANLKQLLLDGTMLPHEPAFEPNYEHYVTWDYCRGFTDAMATRESR